MAGTNKATGCVHIPGKGWVGGPASGNENAISLTEFFVLRTCSRVTSEHTPGPGADLLSGLGDPGLSLDLTYVPGLMSSCEKRK